MIDGKTEEITAGTTGEFHGITVSDFFRTSCVKNEGEMEAMRNMYGCFYSEINSIINGKRTIYPAVGRDMLSQVDNHKGGNGEHAVFVELHY